MASPDHAPRDRLGLLRLFALPGYRGTWIAGSIVSGVRWLEILAASVFVFQITASPFAVSMVMLARLMPNAALGGLIGSLATMFRRETLMAIGFISLGLTRFVLAGLVIFNAIEIWHVMVGMFITGILDCSEYPIRRSLQGDYVPPDQVQRALAFDQFSNVFTMMAGPIAGGLLLDYIGLHGAYLVGASLNAVGATIALRLPPPSNNRPPVRTSIVSNIRDGFRYIRSQHFLIGVLAVTVIFNVFVWP
ncbi:MAG: MFS transporter, partial [Rhodospirillales bacterium]|nr:MFS transporter [Rhodospirillales bacterium]